MTIKIRRGLGVLVAMVLATGIFLAGYFSADCPADYVPPWEFNRYCLFTSKQVDGEVCFALMREFERRRFIHQWFPKRKLRCGITDLKDALASLPKGTSVLWTDWPGTFEYPASNVMEDVIAFARQHEVHIEQSPVVK
jgi:hypothetical protein